MFISYRDAYKVDLYDIDNGLSDGSCTINHLNFNPSTIITHNGLFFDNTKEDIAYIFDQNEKGSGNHPGIYLGFYYC